MHYAAIVGGLQEGADNEHEVEVLEVTPGQYRLHLGGRWIEVDVRATADSTMSFLMDNHAYNIEFEKNPTGGENLLVRGHVVHVEVLDLRKMRLRKVQAHGGGPEGPATIASPMPGKVVAVLVEEGQQVVKGQGLVVVEAMKMENELKAPRDGVVKNLAAQVGSPVNGGAALCVVE